MYNCSDAYYPGFTTSNFLGHSPAIAVKGTSTFPCATLPSGDEFNPVHGVPVGLKEDAGKICSCYSCHGSLCSSPDLDFQPPSMIQRSKSSHSLLSPNPIFLPQEILSSETGPVRKAFSTGDLHKFCSWQCNRRLEILPLQENHNNDGSNQVRRYNKEERKERIKKYMSKRNQRNFNKKITYTCRKTLADSRLRVRGRFARNKEIGESSQTQWSQVNAYENEDDAAWISLLNTFSANLIPWAP